MFKFKGEFHVSLIRDNVVIQKCRNSNFMTTEAFHYVVLSSILNERTVLTDWYIGLTKYNVYDIPYSEAIGNDGFNEFKGYVGNRPLFDYDYSVIDTGSVPMYILDNANNPAIFIVTENVFEIRGVFLTSDPDKSNIGSGHIILSATNLYMNDIQVDDVISVTYRMSLVPREYIESPPGGGYY